MVKPVPARFVAMQPVEFKIVDRDAGPGDYCSAQDPSPYVHLADPAEDLANMVDAEQVVIPRASIRVAISYPLQEEHVFTLNSNDSAGFWRGELALKIAQLYQQIYAEEDRSSAEPAGTIPGLFNRNRTEGTYGIWGHGLGDLDLVWCTSQTETCGSPRWTRSNLQRDHLSWI